MYYSTRLPLHVMPADQARTIAMHAAGQRLQAVGALLWRGLVAIGRAGGYLATLELPRR